MNILITGVAGLIGNNFVRWLLENIKTIKIIGIDRWNSNLMTNRN